MSRYLKFFLSGSSGGSFTQIGEILLLSTSGEVVVISPSALTVNGSEQSNQDRIFNQIIGDSFYLSSNNLEILVDLGEGKQIDLEDLSSVQFYTGTGNNNRDPHNFSFMVSNDGSNFEEVFTETDKEVTSVRGSLAYNYIFSSGSDPVVVGDSVMIDSSQFQVFQNIEGLCSMGVVALCLILGISICSMFVKRFK